MINFKTCTNVFNIRKKKTRPKKLVFILCILIGIIVLLIAGNFIFADSSSEIFDQLNLSVFDQINNLNWADLESALSNITDEFNIFNSISFKEKVQSIIDGNYFTNYNNIFAALFSLIFNNVTKYIPLMFTVVGVALLGQFVDSFRSKSSDGVGDVIHFVVYGVVVILVVAGFKNMINITSSSLNIIKTLTDAIFPIMLTMLTAVGGVVSVGIYKPTIAILSGGVTALFAGFIYPLFIFSFVLVVVGNITQSVKLKSFNDFIFSLFKWTIGFVFTLFGAILSLQGISAGRHDGVSVRATKFAIKTYIPIIGGYLSEGLDFILLGSILIKNAVGVGGLILILTSVLSPIIQLVIFKLMLQLSGAILETVGANRISSFINQCSKVILIPIVMLLGVVFMYILMIALFMCTANVI